MIGRRVNHDECGSIREPAIPFHIENNSVSRPRPGPSLVAVPEFPGEPPHAVADVLKMKSFSISESRVRPAVKGLVELTAGSAAALLQESNRLEIERAINNAKRSAWDKWFRRQWYRAARRQRRFVCFQASHRLSGELRCKHEKSRAAAREFYSGLGYQVRSMSCAVASARARNRSSIIGQIPVRLQGPRMAAKRLQRRRSSAQSVRSCQSTVRGDL